MTATIRPPDVDQNDEPIRMSWMESLGFSQSTSVWSDRPLVIPQHETVIHDTVADWVPKDVEVQLTKRRTRWGLLLSLLVTAGLLTYAGLWFYQRPAAQAEQATASVAAQATQLAAALPAANAANDTLVGGVVDTDALVDVDEAARALFNASSDLNGQPEARSSAATAASMALDGVRLVGDANAYTVAVRPILQTPVLETDPDLIALDEAARSFGEWQLEFDSVRSALPDSVLADITLQLDVLSGNLTSIMESYVDGLREDSQQAAQVALTNLGALLDQISAGLDIELTNVQTRAGERFTNSKEALDSLVG